MIAKGVRNMIRDRRSRPATKFLDRISEAMIGQIWAVWLEDLEECIWRNVTLWSGSQRGTLQMYWPPLEQPPGQEDVPTAEESIPGATSCGR